jgi:phenylalanyl-tRNA synthetase beta chain
LKVLLSWLKEFVDVAVEPGRLGEDLTLAGLALDGLETQGQDAVLDLDITTNRVDCMNVYGVAREVSVLYGLPLRPMELTVHESTSPLGFEVTIEAGDLCPRFCARVLDVRVGPSPAWLRDRLEVVGVRPINNVVDLTNYVMLEMGQPSHAFDLARIPKGHLQVRWAREGERLTTLDGVERALSPKTGVVAGREGPLALAGIMGGRSSEVSPETRTIALEAAYWEPLAIRRAAKVLLMHTEASHRFERGADPEAPPVALARMGHLLERIGGGNARRGLVDVSSGPRGTRRVALRMSRLAQVLGTPVPAGRCREILLGLGFGIEREAAESLTLRVPSWRGDVSREVDLIEEVGRHYGFGKIPSTLPKTTGGAGLLPAQARERRLRDLLVGAGLDEVINYAFVSDEAAAPTGGPRVALENPLAEVQGVLRDSLVIPGLLTNLKTNLRQGRRDVRLFEIGRVFRGGASLEEQRHLGLLLTGAARGRHWSEKPRATDFFDMKGLVEVLVAEAGMPEFGREGLPGFLHPGKAASLTLSGKPVGFLGALSPGLAESWELRDEAFLAELDLDPILLATKGPVRVQPLDRFPSVGRDLSIESDLSASALEEAILTAGGELLRSVSIVDRYEGPPVPEGKVSLTVSLRYQHPDRTLTSEEVQASLERVIRELRSAGAEIRGE